MGWLKRRRKAELQKLLGQELAKMREIKNGKAKKGKLEKMLSGHRAQKKAEVKAEAQRKVEEAKKEEKKQLQEAKTEEKKSVDDIKKEETKKDKEAKNNEKK